MEEGVEKRWGGGGSRGEDEVGEGGQSKLREKELGRDLWR